VFYSNNYAWVCDESLSDQPNIALSQPRNRWKKWDESWPQLLSEDIQFYNSGDYLQNFTGSPVNENKLYLTVAMRFSGVDETDSVANIGLKFYQPLNDNLYYPYGDMPLPSSYVELPLISTDNISYGTTIFGEEYPVNLMDSYGNYKFEYYVDLPDYGTYTYYQLTKEGYFYHINPEITWSGNGRMVIDYIILEDDFARSVRLQQENSPYLARLDTHLNNIDDPLNNILYHYTMDEPCHGQMQMYNYLEDHLSNMDPPKKMITVNYPRHSVNLKHDGKRYNHPKLFLEVAQPDRIMIDAYPLQFIEDYFSWINPSAGDFVQRRIDDILHYYYYSTVRNVLDSNNPDTELYFVPQIFGNWDIDSNYWTYHMPPRNMTKCLQLLPLCYAADGVVSFAIATDPTRK